jgi:hypothetical protein
MSVQRTGFRLTALPNVEFFLIPQGSTFNHVMPAPTTASANSLAGAATAPAAPSPATAKATAIVQNALATTPKRESK